MGQHTLRGIVRPRRGVGEVTGYRVTARFQRRIGGGDTDGPPSDDTADDTGIRVPAVVSARLDDGGRFELDLDARPGRPVAPIEVSVSTPSGLEQLSRALDLDDLGKTLRLQVSTPRPAPLEPSTDPSKGARIRLAGRVVDRRGATVPAGLPVLISTEDADGIVAPVVATTTQSSGAFSADWPSASYASAQATVAGSGAVPIALDGDGRLAQQLLVVLDVPTTEGVDEPTCCDEAATPMGVDEGDLTANPGAFAQDLGGNCLGLSTPDRTIEEFTYYTAVRTTEPRVSGLTLVPPTDVPSEMVADLLGIAVATEWIERGVSSLQRTTSEQRISLTAEAAYHLVRTDVAPAAFDVVDAAWHAELDEVKDTITATVHEVTDRRHLTLDHSIDWDDSPTIYLAVDLAFGHLLRFRQSFKANGFSLGNLLYSLPLAPGQRRQIAILDWDRETRSERTETLTYEERLDAVLTRDRDILELVSSELTEDMEASSRATTGGVSGGLGLGFIGPGWGVFAGASGGYSESGSTASQSATRQFAADTLQQMSDQVSQRSSSLRDQRSTVVQSVSQREQARAETEFVGNYNRCHSLTIEYFQVLRHLLVTHELADVEECVFVPLPMDFFDDAKALRWREPLTRRLRDRRLVGGFQAMQRIADDWVGWDVPEGSYAEAPPEVVDGELRISFLLPRPRDDEDSQYQVSMWEPLAPFLDTDPFELFTAKLNGQSQEARDRIYQREIAPTIAARIVDSMRLAFVSADGTETDVPIDPSLISSYEQSVPLYVTLNPSGAVPAVPRQDITHIKIWVDCAPLTEGSQVVVHEGKVRYRTDTFTAVFFDRDRILDDLDAGDDVVVAAPLTPRELRNPRDEDRELATRLRNHLNEFIEFYHQVLWMSLDPQRRFMLLDAVLVPGLGGRSVASVCTNRVMGIVGNSLVLPVAPGLRLDHSFAAEDGDEPVSLLDAYATAPLPPIRISLPTRGVHAEAVQGSCQACETIDDTRYWRWSNEGMLELPGIAAVSTESRASTEPDLTPEPLPTPLVTIQNAPAAPEPTGLSSAFQLLSTPGVFRDVTGLAGNQENTAAALKAATSAASAIGDQAYNLATQQALGQSAQRLFGQLTDAHDQGLLTDEAYGELGADLLAGLIGTTAPKAPVPWLDPDLAAAAANASSGSITASNSEESIDIEYEDAQGGGAAGPWRGSSPLYLPEMVQPLGMDTSYDYLRRFAGDEAMALAVSRGYLAQAESVDEPPLVRCELRIVFPEVANAPGRVAGEDRLPVVFVVHGAGEYWTADGETRRGTESFDYLQDALAAAGFISVGVDVAAQPFVETSGGLVASAVERIRGLDADPTSPLAGRVSTGSFGLLGYGRGGTDVADVLDYFRTRPPAERERFAATCVVGPYNRNYFHLTALDTDALLILQPGLDGEVSPMLRSLQQNPIQMYDDATCERALVVLQHCNHRRFDALQGDATDTLPDRTEHVDADRLAGADDHHALLAEYATSFFRWRMLDDLSGRDLIDGTRPNGLDMPTIVAHDLGTGNQTLDSFRLDGAEGGTRTLDGATIASLADIEIDGTPLDDLTAHAPGPVLWIPPGQSDDPVYSLVLGVIKWSDYDDLAIYASTSIDLSSQATIDNSRLPEFVIRVTDDEGDQHFDIRADQMLVDHLSGRPLAHVVAQLDDSLTTATWLPFITLTADIRQAVDGLTWYPTRIDIVPIGGFPQHLFIADIALRRR